MMEKASRSDLLVVYRDPKELAPYARNARTHSKHQIEEIRASIREFGFTNPVLLKDDERTIGAGHARTLAAVKEGLPRIPTITLPGLTETQWRAYVIADNKLALNAGWDESLLRLEFADLKLEGFDLELTGFEGLELTGLLDPGSSSAGKYSGKLETPSYIPRGDAPAVEELFDEAKTKELQAEIRTADLPAEIAYFLAKAAERHTIFDFHRIADYYANASPEVQRLFEKSALVIIDFDSAIEYGFVQVHKAIAAMALKDEDAA